MHLFHRKSFIKKSDCISLCSGAQIHVILIRKKVARRFIDSEYFDGMNCVYYGWHTTACQCSWAPICGERSPSRRISGSLWNIIEMQFREASIRDQLRDQSSILRLHYKAWESFHHTLYLLVFYGRVQLVSTGRARITLSNCDILTQIQTAYIGNIKDVYIRLMFIWTLMSFYLSTSSVWQLIFLRWCGRLPCSLTSERNAGIRMGGSVFSTQDDSCFPIFI